MINTEITKVISKKLQMYDSTILQINNKKNQQKLIDWLTNELANDKNYRNFSDQLSIDFHHNLFITKASNQIPAGNLIIKSQNILRNRLSIKNWAKTILLATSNLLQDDYQSQASLDSASKINWQLDTCETLSWSPMFSVRSYADYIVANLDKIKDKDINIHYLRKDPFYLARQLLINFHAEMFKDGGVLNTITRCFEDMADKNDSTICTLYNKIIVELNNPKSVIATTGFPEVDFCQILELSDRNEVTLPMRTIFISEYERRNNKIRLHFHFVNDFDYTSMLNELYLSLNFRDVTKSNLTIETIKCASLGEYRDNIEQEINAISPLNEQPLFKKITMELQRLLKYAK